MAVLQSTMKWNQISGLFKNDTSISLIYAPAQTWVQHETVWNFMRKEFKLSCYKLEMGTTSSETDV